MFPRNVKQASLLGLPFYPHPWISPKHYVQVGSFSVYNILLYYSMWIYSISFQLHKPSKYKQHIYLASEWENNAVMARGMNCATVFWHSVICSSVNSIPGSLQKATPFNRPVRGHP